MDTISYTKKYFKGLSKAKLNRWIFKNRKELATAALFTATNKGIGKLIKHFTKKNAIENDFIPCHVGNIIAIGEEIWVMNIIPPKAEITLLSDYIFNSNFDYEIVTFNGINKDLYFSDSLKHNNKKYGYASALQCAFKALQWLPNRKQHCSEYFIRCLQKQGYFKDVKADNVSPVQAYNLLMYNRLK